MIVGSVLLVLVAGVLLGLGVIFVDEPLLYSSIGVSALAALFLVLGVKRLVARRAGRGVIAVRIGTAPIDATMPGHDRPRPMGRATPRPVGRATVPSTVTDEIPPGEPEEQPVPADDAARLRLLDAEVVVVDGRPRYHLASCAHLEGSEWDRLAVAEALESGFSACAACRPATALLGEGARDGGGG